MQCVQSKKNSGDKFATPHVVRASSAPSRYVGLNRLRTSFQRADEGRVPAINQTRYQHKSKAGNLGDVVKHAFLSRLLEDAYQSPQAQGYDIVIDTHAGLGLYPSPSCQDFRTYAPSEMDTHDAGPLAAYQRALRHAQEELGPHAYPGSPFIISSYANGHLAAPVQGRGVQASTVSITMCEIDEQAAAQLATNCSHHRSLQPQATASSVRVLDGCDAWKAVPQILAQQIEAHRRDTGSAPKALVFIDPPFQSAVEYDELIDCLHELALLAECCKELDMVIWFPLVPRLSEANERLRAGAQAAVDEMRKAQDRRYAHRETRASQTASALDPTPSGRLLRSMAQDAGADEMWAGRQAPLEVHKMPAGTADNVLPTVRSLAVDAGADELWAGLPEEEQARLRVMGSNSASHAAPNSLWSMLHSHNVGKIAQAAGNDALWADLQGLEHKRNPRGASNAVHAGKSPVTEARGTGIRPWGGDGAESDLWEDLKRKQPRTATGCGGAALPAKEPALGAAYAWLECWRAPEHDSSFQGLNGCGLLFFGAADAVEGVSDWGFELAEAVVQHEKAAYPQAGCFQEVGEAISTFAADTETNADDVSRLQFWRRWG